MDTRILIAVADETLRTSTRATFDEISDVEVIGVVETSNDVLVVLADAELDIVFVHSSVGPLPMLALCREIVQRRPDVAVVLMTAADERGLSDAMDAGARAVMGAPPTLDDLQSRMPGVISWVRSVRALGRVDSGDGGVGGRLVAVVGAKGGVGTTTVAANLALIASQAMRERRVCLIDADLQQSGVPHLLDLTARRSILDLAAVADNISGRNIDETVIMHRTGLRVLPAPANGEQGGEMDAAAARQVLAAVRGHYDLVIVDCGSVLNDVGATALELADDVALVATADVPALRAARAKVGLFRRLQLTREDDVVTLVNRTSPRNDVQPDLARRIVGTRIFRIALPEDWRSLQEVSNSGRPEEMRDGPFRRAVHALARELRLLAEPEEVAESPPSKDRREPSSRRRRARGRRRGEPAESPGADPGEAREPVPAGRGERGQISVEALMGVATAVAILFVMAQLVLYAMGFVAAGRAADAAARAASRADEAGARQAAAYDAARLRTPEYFDVSVDELGPDRYAATVDVPDLVPFLGDLDVESTAAATD